MAVVRVDPVIGRVHGVTKSGDTLCGTVGNKVRGSLNLGSISCEKCQRIINKSGAKQDETGKFNITAEARDLALYGEKSVDLGKKTTKKPAAKKPPKK